MVVIGPTCARKGRVASACHDGCPELRNVGESSEDRLIDEHVPSELIILHLCAREQNDQDHTHLRDVWSTASVQPSINDVNDILVCTYPIEVQASICR